MLDVTPAVAATTPASRSYRPAEIEPRWQEAWEQARVFELDSPPVRPKWYVLELPPFATGQLHLGHARNYVLADAGARFRRMLGHDVLYTSGFDTFGLPTELAAVAAGCRPEVLAQRCADAMAEQFVRLGLSHDRRRLTCYHVPEYYRWVQWVFVRLFEAGHCFRREAAIDWCPDCDVTLAASLAEGGRCWRCGAEVQKRTQPQWFVRESTFADAMLQGLEHLPGWPDWVKRVHRDWIGRRPVLRLLLPTRPQQPDLEICLDEDVPVCALRFVAIGGDHALARGWTRPQGSSVLTGAVAHAAGAGGVTIDLPVVLEDIPGASARAGMPSRSAVDAAIAARHGIDAPAGQDATCDLEAMLCAGQARHDIIYRLQDWNIARNRYWGPPVPIIHCPACGAVAVPETDLPVLLPHDVEPAAAGNPLQGHTLFQKAACPRCGAAARRDTETLEAYSSPWWYHWICRAPGAVTPFEDADARTWLPVDVMIGGSDQVRSCFFHVRMIARALSSMQVAAVEEPVDTLLVVGMVKQDGRKMSKTAGNTIDLDTIVSRYGCDALRLAVLGAAAPHSDFEWSDALVRKSHAFLTAVWNFVFRIAQAECVSAESSKARRPFAPLHQRLRTWMATGKQRIESNLRRHDYHLAVRNLQFLFERLLTFERAVAQDGRMEVYSHELLSRSARSLVLMLAPFAPHLSEELWHELGGEGLAAAASWPHRDAADHPSQPALEMQA